MTRKHFVLMMIGLLLAMLVTTVQAGGQINMVHHFGGDVLFCDLENGCRALNMEGDLLWEVDQTTIDAAMATACESGVSQNIEAGQGTYGPMILEVNCYSANGSRLKLIGYDEHGKQNEMPFQPNYAPVNAPVSHNETSGDGDSGGGCYCQVDLDAGNYLSFDFIHFDEGWDVWYSNDSIIFNEPGDTFLYWTGSNPGLPDCIF